MFTFLASSRIEYIIPARTMPDQLWTLLIDWKQNRTKMLFSWATGVVECAESVTKSAVAGPIVICTFFRAVLSTTAQDAEDFAGLITDDAISEPHRTWWMRSRSLRLMEKDEEERLRESCARN